MVKYETIHFFGLFFTFLCRKACKRWGEFAILNVEEAFMKKYFNHRIKKAIVVQNLITIESLTIEEDFNYPEERHDFHEFAYVDSGAIDCHTGEEITRLSQGDFFLITPSTPHFYSTIAGIRADIFIVCFRCNAEILSILHKKIALSAELRFLLLDLLQEAKNAYTFPFNRKLKLKQAPLYASQQLVENNMEKLLVYLVRNETNQNEQIKLVTSSVEKENSLINDVLGLLEAHLYARITLDEISKQTYYSKTFLNRIFKKSMGTSIMQYYNDMKINEAKNLIRKNHTPSAIAVKLGFESTSYFTKAFKKRTGVTPSAYKNQILS